MTKKFQNLDEVQKFLFYELPQFARDGVAAYEPGIEKTYRILEKLGNPQLDFAIIHIGGTNGKGSCSQMLTAGLMAHGMKVGTYTSPHLVEYRERITVSGRYISDRFLIDFVNDNFALILELKPTFFEFNVALAVSYFSSEKVDIAVIEVGMGGTFDSTNVVHPILSVITNVGLDHQNTLGHTLSEIAENKAGIIKPYTPVVIGHCVDEVKDIFLQKSKRENTSIRFSEEAYRYDFHDVTEDHLVVNYKHEGREVQVKSSLRGLYQIQNIATVLTACDVLDEKYPGIRAHSISAMAHLYDYVSFSGRWQVLEKNPKVIVDVCHNADGVAAALPMLAHESFDKLWIIIGLSSDKSASEILQLLPTDAHLIFTHSDSRRAMDIATLKANAEPIGLKYEVEPSVKQAYVHALKSADKEDLILILGSCYVVGELL